MKGQFKRIAEARLNPDKEFIQELGNIVDDSKEEYAQDVVDNEGEHDIDELVDILNSHAYDLPVIFINNPDPINDPPGFNDWVSAIADWNKEQGKTLAYILHAVYIEQGFKEGYGLDDLKEIIQDITAHETIHFGQYDTMGEKGLTNYKSGHQKGTEKKEKTGKTRDWERMYLRDPQEIMAYGNDLSREIADLDNPQEVIRNVEGHKSQLPTYEKFRKIFDKDTPQIKRLLKYASQYLADRFKETNEEYEAELNEFKNTIKRILK